MLRLCLALLVFSVAAERCKYDVHESFDDEDVYFVFPGTEQDTSFKAVGAGSVVFDANGDGGEYVAAPPRQYTSISFYMAFGDTDSLPTFSLSGADGEMGWAMSLKPTGLDLTGDIATHIPVVVAIKKFYFFEFLIDYAAGTMTLLMDGQVKSARNAPLHPGCLDGIKYVTFFEGQGWLDELRLEETCSYYAVTGTLGSAVHNELVAGGLVLTITRSSGVWVDTEATKQALIDGLVADNSSRAQTGWNALKSTMMTTALVTISGSNMTLGPLYPAASFYERASTLVTLKLKDSMVATGLLGAVDDWYFVISSSPLLCPAGEEVVVADGAFPQSTVDNDFKAEGAGSTFFPSVGNDDINNFVVFRDRPTRLQYTNISFYLTSGGGVFVVGRNPDCWIFELPPLEKFYFYEILIDYPSETWTLRVDGEVVRERVEGTSPECFTGVNSFLYYSGPGWLDDLRMRCPGERTPPPADMVRGSSATPPPPGQ
ncbi:hypothetical protein DIPPA_25198 [Diplonema papillatum]|nr:hypothetical protein DIPPA_25198 [Diplonema papillatum]